MSQSPCCPPGSKPFLKEDPNYVPKGEMITFNEVRAYKIGSGKLGFIFMHDIFGLETGLNKLLCDTLSANDPNITVIAPDLFPHGNLLGNDPFVERGAQHLFWKVVYSALTCRMWGYFSKYSWENCTEAVFNKTTAHTLNELGCDRLVLCGVCWGSFFGYKACSLAEHKSRIIGNISVHPSVDTLAKIYKESWQDLVNAVEVPQMLASTKDETADWKPNGYVDEALRKKPFGSKCRYYAYTEGHGFFTRGDTKVAATSEAIGEVITNMKLFYEGLEEEVTPGRI